MDDIKPMLRRVGFKKIEVKLKEESKEFIKDWMPGTGCEDYVVSAAITAIKPVKKKKITITGGLSEKAKKKNKIKLGLLAFAIVILIVADLMSAQPNYMSCLVGFIGTGWFVLENIANRKKPIPKKPGRKLMKGG